MTSIVDAVGQFPVAGSGDSWVGSDFGVIGFTQLGMTHPTGSPIRVSTHRGFSFIAFGVDHALIWSFRSCF
jgi:hypothetical protein